MDPDDVSAGKRSLPRSGGHERLVCLQRDAETGRVRQPGVPEEDGLRRRDLPQTPLHQTDPTGRRHPDFLFSFSQLSQSFGVKSVKTQRKSHN